MQTPLKCCFARHVWYHKIMNERNLTAPFRNVLAGFFVFLIIYVVLAGTHTIGKLVLQSFKYNSTKIEQQKNADKDVLAAEIEINAAVGLSRVDFVVYPEKRIPSNNNWDTFALFQIRDGDTGDIVYSSSGIPVDSNGNATVDFTSGSFATDAPTYDITVKGTSHLTKAYTGIVFTGDSSFRTFDFTPYGDLPAGDTHSSADNFINSLDLSTMITRLGSSDYVCDLNQDTTVNSLDISIQIYNFGKHGD